MTIEIEIILKFGKINILLFIPNILIKTLKFN